MANRLNVLVGATFEQNTEKKLDNELKSISNKLKKIDVGVNFNIDAEKLVKDIRKAVSTVNLSMKDFGKNFENAGSGSTKMADGFKRTADSMDTMSKAAKKSTKVVTDLEGRIQKFSETVDSGTKKTTKEFSFGKNGISSGKIIETDNSGIVFAKEQEKALNKAKEAAEKLELAQKDISRSGAWDTTSAKNYEKEIVEIRNKIESADAKLSDFENSAERLKQIGIEVKTKIDVDEKWNKALAKLESDQNIKSIKLSSQYGDLFDENKFRSYYKITESVNAELKKQKPEWEKIDDLIKNAERSANQYVAEVASANKELKNNERNAKILDSTLGRFVEFHTLGQVFSTGERAISSMVDAVSTLDSSMVELKKVTDETDGTYNKFMDDAADKAKKLGITISDYIDSTTNFARSGYDFVDAQTVAETANIMQMVSENMTADEASEYLISTMAGFQIEAENTLGIVDALNNVSNNFSITTDGLGEALKRSSAAMSAANNTLEETIALTTAANQVVQNPETVGNALKTISMDFVALHSNMYRKTYLKRGILNAA